MKFLLILPLLLGTVLSTFFLHKNVHKRVHDVKYPTVESFWTQLGYSHHNSRHYPAYQSSGFIPHSPSTHLHLTDLRHNLPIIIYHDIKPVVEGAYIPILMPISSYDKNHIFKTQTGTVWGPNHGRNNKNSAVEENINEVFMKEKDPHLTGKIIKEKTICTISNIGGKNCYQSNTGTGQISDPTEFLGGQHNFRGGQIFESSLGSDQFNTASSSGTGGLPYQNTYLGEGVSMERGPGYPTGSEMKNAFFGYPNSDPEGKLRYPIINFEGNTMITQNLPLDLRQLSNGISSIQKKIVSQTTVKGHPIENQFPFSGSGFPQPQTVFWHYNQLSQPWMDYHMRFPFQSGASQRYPGVNEQYPSQSVAFQRIQHRGTTGEHSTPSVEDEQYSSQGGDSQQYPPLEGANGQYISAGGPNGRNTPEGGALQRYPPLSGAYGQFFYAGGVIWPFFLLPEVNGPYPPKGAGFEQNFPQTVSYKRYPPKTQSNLSSRLKEINPLPKNESEVLVSPMSRIKEDAPKDKPVTNVVVVQEPEGEIIEKGLVAVKAPPVAGVTKTEVVAEKGLIAIKAPASVEVKGDIKNGESIKNSPANIETLNDKLLSAAGAGSAKIRVVVEHGLIANSALPNGVVDGDVREKASQASPTNIEIHNAEEVESTKTKEIFDKGLTGIEVPSSGGMTGDVRNERTMENSPTNIKAPDVEALSAAGVEGTQAEGEIKKGLIRIEKPSNVEVKVDVINEKAIQTSPTNIEANDREVPPSAEMVSIKTEEGLDKGPVGIGAQSSVEVKGDVKNEKTLKVEPTNIDAPDYKETVNGKLKESVDIAVSPLSVVVADNSRAGSIIERLDDIEKPLDDNVVDAESINEPNKTTEISDKKLLDKDLVDAVLTDKSNGTKLNSGKELVEDAKYGPGDKGTEITYKASDNLPSENRTIIGKEYVSEIKVPEKKIDQTSEISLGPDPVVVGPDPFVDQPIGELTENSSKIQTRDTTNILGEPQTISFTIRLPPKIITTKTVSLVSEQETKDGHEVNVVPIHRVQTVAQKSGAYGLIEPTVMNGPNGYQISLGSSGNIEINQQGEGSTHVFNLDSILGLAKAVADGNNEVDKMNQNKLK